jgi:hypothetical protein
MSVLNCCRGLGIGAWLMVQSATVAAEGDWMLLEGKATDIETGQHIYSERHSLAMSESGQWIMETDYLGPDGDLWAERSVWFDASNARAPEYQFVDYRDGYEEGATRSQDGLIELYKEIMGERSSVFLEPEKLTNLVIDAGFSAVIEQKWDNLLQGKSVTFDFASSARLTTVQFRLSHRRNIGDESVEEFKLEPANWFIRMLVKPIYLTYNADQKTLISYEGLSNLRREGGGNYSVKIAFPQDHQFTMRQLPSALRQAVP